MAHADNSINFPSRLTHNSFPGNYLNLPNEIVQASQSLMPFQSTNSMQNAFSGNSISSVVERNPSAKKLTWP